jgi:hypothetical protein
MKPAPTIDQQPELAPFPAEPVLTYFGAVARWMGFLTTREIMDAFALQVHEENEGLPRRRIGEICRDLGFMTQPQVDEVMAFLNARRGVQ